MVYNFGKTPDRSLILEIGRVRDLAGSPGSLVCGVWDQRCEPLALVVGVCLVGTTIHTMRYDSRESINNIPLPFTTARNGVALGIGNSGGNVVAIFFVIPFFRLAGVYMRIRYTTRTRMRSMEHKPGSAIVSGSSSSQSSGFFASMSRIS